MRSLIFALAIAFSQFTHASCDAFDQVREAGLYESDAFWEDFAKLSTKGQPSDAQVAQLVAKHKASASPQSAAPSTSSTTLDKSPRASLVGNRQIQLHRDAEKGLDKALPQVQNKFDDLVQMIDEKGTDGALQELRKIRSWNLEPMRGHPGQYSIRLNEGYRAVFEVKDGVMSVRNIGQHIYKH